MGLSKVSEICNACEHYAVEHNYRDIKIAENTTVTIDIEEMKKKMREDFYKNLGCGFLSEG